MKRILLAFALLAIVALVAWWLQARSLPRTGVEAIDRADSFEKPTLEAPLEPVSDSPREPVAEPPAPTVAVPSVPPEIASKDLVFHARAADSVTRVAVAGAKVKWKSAELETDLDGRFSVHGEDWIDASLQLDAAGYSRVWVLPTTGHETAETAFEIVLSKSATLRVHVLEASGQAIVGANVTAVVARYKVLQPQESGVRHPAVYNDDTFSAKTDGTGTAVLANLPARAGMKLSASRLRESLRAEAAELVLQPGEERELTWRIGTGCRVFGTVTAADGQPTEGQEIWLQPARMAGARFFERFDQEGRKQTRCDARGEYEFADVTPGGWWIGPADERGQSGSWKEGLVAAWAEHIGVSAELQEIRQDIVLTRDLAIRGRVEDSRGNPVATDVHAARGTSEIGILTQSGDDGTFVIGPLVPGSYRLVAGAFGGMSGRAETASHELKVPAGSNDVVLRLQMGCSISGRVVDADSGEALQARLTLTPDSGQEGIRFSMRSTTTSSKPAGDFSMKGLPPGVYSLTASTLTGRIGTLRSFALAPGADRVGIELRVVRGATVDVFYDGSAPYGNAQMLSDGVPIAGDGIQKGTRHSFTVPAGRCVARMTLYPARTSFEIAFDLKAGETKGLTFDGAWK